jgi:hypothetical protein
VEAWVDHGFPLEDGNGDPGRVVDGVAELLEW